MGRNPIIQSRRQRFAMSFTTVSLIVHPHPSPVPGACFHSFSGFLPKCQGVKTSSLRNIYFKCLALSENTNLSWFLLCYLNQRKAQQAKKKKIVLNISVGFHVAATPHLKMWAISHIFQHLETVWCDHKQIFTQMKGESTVVYCPMSEPSNPCLFIHSTIKSQLHLHKIHLDVSVDLNCLC